MYICISMKSCFFLLLLFCNVFSFGQSVVVNEIMSSNDNVISDDDGDYSDWIELHNQTEEPVSLLGHYLSDDLSNIDRWPLPDIILEPDEYLVIFASGKDRNDVGQELHTNFSLGSDGEEVFISFSGTIIHQLPPMALPANRSFGILPGGMQPVVFLNSTPGSPNISFPVILDSLHFSHEGGVYQESFTLEVESTSGDYSIFYTTDGTTPTAENAQYLDPLYLDNALISTANISQIQISPNHVHDPPEISDVLKSIVIRAAAFDNSGNQVSEVYTHSYFISELGVDHGSLPVVSICADHEDLFDYETGIFVPGIHWAQHDSDWTGNYYMRGRQWEREVSLEIIDGENKGVRQNAGFRTHGGATRRDAQKGMRLYARSEYGKSRFDYAAFADKKLDSYKRLVLKPFISSWSEAGIEDPVCASMAIEFDVDFIASRPVVVYLNGEYWGIYFLQERIDDRYLEDNFNMHVDDVDLIESWSGAASEGNNADFLAFMEYVANQDLEEQTSYNYVASQMDIQNFIDYQLFEIFIANYDWPSNNMKCWKRRASGGKWRWIFFDGDAALSYVPFPGFSHALNTGNEPWPTNFESTLLLRKLLENENFKDSFLSRLGVLMNNQLEPDKTVIIAENAADAIRTEVANQSQRFNEPTDVNSWEEAALVVTDFLAQRSCIVRDQAEELFQRIIGVRHCDPPIETIADFHLYPNPNPGSFTVLFHSNQDAIATVDVIDISGKQIIQMRETVHKGNNYIGFSMDQLNPGYYIVQLHTPDAAYTQKMMVLD